NLLAEPDVVVPLLLEACKPRAHTAASTTAPDGARRTYDVLSLRAVAAALNEATEGVEVCLTRLPLGWPGEARHFAHPLDYLGGDGGAGVGAGPGITVGAGLALKGSGRIPIGLIGDGDYLMGLTALWTAAHYQIPCLFVVCNNRSFYNDEAHQERVARMRGRPVENKWIGQRINEPDIDLAALAVAQGARRAGGRAGRQGHRPGHGSRRAWERDRPGREGRAERRGLRDRRARAARLRRRHQRRARDSTGAGRPHVGALRAPGLRGGPGRSRACSSRHWRRARSARRRPRPAERPPSRCRRWAGRRRERDSQLPTECRAHPPRSRVPAHRSRSPSCTR